MLQDFRYSLRAAAKRPSFTFATVLVLGLAVGVNTAVFSLINGFLLQPLPVRAADQLGFVYYSNERGGYISYASYQLLSQQTDAFSGIAARGGDSGRLRVGDDIVPLQGEAVSANYFDLLGVAPRIGRGFQPSEETAAATPVVLISEGLWKSHFAAVPDIAGRTLRIDTPGMFSGRYTGWRDFTIVGVMPATFTGTGNPWQPAQYWVLLVQRAADYRAVRERDTLANRPVVPIARLKPGVTFAQARSAVDAAGRDILQQSPFAMKAGDTLQLLASRRVRPPFSGAYVMDMPRITATLAAVGTMLLLIAGANLAGMLLARGVSRRGEIAIRLSLGMSRIRLVRQLLMESVLFAFGGGCAGLLAARLLVAAALHELPAQIPGSSGGATAVDVPVDLRVIAFAFGSCFLTALLVGLAPAAQAMKVDLLSALGGGNGPASRRTRSPLRRLVLVPQIALSLVLLLVTGMFVRHMLRLELAPRGYDAAQVVALDVQLPPRPLETEEQRDGESAVTREAFTRILDRLTALPGVTSAALTSRPPNGMPLAASSTSVIARSDYETTRQYRGVTAGYVSADYFKTLGIPLRRGRVFDARDRESVATSVIVSERLANELWPGKDPVGQQMAQHWANSIYPVHWLDVVGVVASATLPLEEYPRPVFYLPIESMPLEGSTILVRGDGRPAELVARAKQAIAQAERSAIVAQAHPLEETISAVRFPRRFSAALLGASGTAALILAAIGVFGLMSYAVAQRVGEIGVRMVLGAQRRDIIRLVLGDGAGVLIAGTVTGFGLGFAAIRYASHAIVPLPDIDAPTFIAVPAVLIAVVLLACYLPARRAAKVDPLVVLRTS